MTFTEAAAQVLRLVGKPLHYKEITDVAIEKNLLSHVGKSPEVTMGARLAALVKKNDKDNPLIRIKPGVFALREWDESTIQRGLADRTPALDRLAALEVEPEPEPEDEEEEEGDGAPQQRATAAEEEEEEEEEAPAPPDEDERARAEIAASAGELFEAEEDDDLPIFGGDDEEGDAGAAQPREGRRRRRRRRRGRGGDESRGDDLPSYTVSDAPADLGGGVDLEAEPAERADDRAERPERERPEGERPERERPERERPERERPERERPERERPERERPERERAERPERERPERERPERERPERERFERERPEHGERPERERREGRTEELVGRELSDVLAGLLATFDRNRGPVAVQAVIDSSARRGRALGELGLGPGALLAVARADNLRREADGQRPRFRILGNRLALTDWLLDGELARLERDLVALADRFREASRRALLRKLQELPQRAFGELMAVLLERAGMTELASVKRPGAHGAEIHLSAKANGPAGELRTAIVVRRDGREIGRERVTELRGALHHYGPAAAGWLVTTGQVLSGAREEAAAAGAAPVTLVDGATLSRLCEQHGVAVIRNRLILPLPDLDLLDALRGG